MALIYFPGQGLVGVGEVHAGGRDVVELLALPGRGLGDVDYVLDLAAAEAGDARLSCRPGRRGSRGGSGRGPTVRDGGCG
jgi:hypothetical protein